MSIYQNKIIELKNNKKDKNYIENKINEIKNALEKCLEDDKCYSDIFNEIIDRIIVHKQSDKQIKLDIFIKTGESVYTTSDNLGKKFHLLDPVTPDCLRKESFSWETIRGIMESRLEMKLCSKR